MNLGGTLFLELIDQPWACGGHPPAASGGGGGGTGASGAREARVAAAQTEVAALVQAVVPVAATGAKIRFTYAPGVNPEFATAAELRAALLASYPDAADSGAPIVRRGREDVAPAWGWAIDPSDPAATGGRRSDSPSSTP